VVTLGVAIGLAIETFDKPVEGLHEYETPPVAPNCTELPVQIVISLPAFAIAVFTLTVTLAVLLQPLVLVITV
jgi:hypothetical protein